MYCFSRCFKLPILLVYWKNICDLAFFLSGELPDLCGGNEGPSDHLDLGGSLNHPQSLLSHYSRNEAVQMFVRFTIQEMKWVVRVRRHRQIVTFPFMSEQREGCSNSLFSIVSKVEDRDLAVLFRGVSMLFFDECHRKGHFSTFKSSIIYWPKD